MITKDQWATLLHGLLAKQAKHPNRDITADFGHICELDEEMLCGYIDYISLDNLYVKLSWQRFVTFDIVSRYDDIKTVQKLFTWVVEVLDE